MPIPWKIYPEDRFLDLTFGFGSSSPRICAPLFAHAISFELTREFVPWDKDGKYPECDVDSTDMEEAIREDQERICDKVESLVLDALLLYPKDPDFETMAQGEGDEAGREAFEDSRSTEVREDYHLSKYALADAFVQFLRLPLPDGKKCSDWQAPEWIWDENPQYSANDRSHPPKDTRFENKYGRFPDDIFDISSPGFAPDVPTSLRFGSRHGLWKPRKYLEESILMANLPKKDVLRYYQALRDAIKKEYNGTAKWLKGLRVILSEIDHLDAIATIPLYNHVLCRCNAARFALWVAERGLSVHLPDVASA